MSVAYQVALQNRILLYLDAKHSFSKLRRYVDPRSQAFVVGEALMERRAIELADFVSEHNREKPSLKEIP